VYDPTPDGIRPSLSLTPLFADEPGPAPLFPVDHGRLHEEEMAEARGAHRRRAPAAAVSVVYDTGALIAADRSDRRLWARHRARLQPASCSGRPYRSSHPPAGGGGWRGDHGEPEQRAEQQRRQQPSRQSQLAHPPLVDVRCAGRPAGGRGRRRFAVLLMSAGSGVRLVGRRGVGVRSCRSPDASSEVQLVDREPEGKDAAGDVPGGGLGGVAPGSTTSTAATLAATPALRCPRGEDGVHVVVGDPAPPVSPSSRRAPIRKPTAVKIPCGEMARGPRWMRTSGS